MTTSKYGEDLKEALFKARLPEDDVEVPGVGTVRVRGLSRAEVMLMRKATDTEAMDGSRALILERKMLALGMVDPQLTEAEAGQWQHASAAGELDLVSDRIAELSGMAEGAPKSGLPGDGDGPGPGV
jgi:hypothetical protein